MAILSRSSAAVVSLVCLALAACSQSMTLAPNKADGVLPGEATFAQFKDIPIPSGASMNMERSFIFGAQDSWIGRMVLTTSGDPGAAFDFYKNNAPQFGWEEVTTVRSLVSVLTYTRGERVLTIQIQGRTIMGSEIDLTVSPRGAPGAGVGPMGSGSGPGMGRAPAIPVQRVP